MANKPKNRDFDELFSLFSRLTSDTIFLISENGDIKIASSSIEEISGYLPSELVGINMMSILHQDDVEKMKSFLSKLLASPNSSVFSEARVQKKKGGLAWVFATGKNLLLDSQIESIVVIFRDITDQKNTQNERLELAKRVNLLLESTYEGIYGLDLAGNCVLMNKSGAALLGYGPSELIGRQLHGIIHNKRSDNSPYPLSECQIFQTIKTGKGVRSDNEVFWKKDGSAIPVEYSSYPIIDDGVIKGVVVSFNDISERKKAQHELLMLRKAVESSAEIIFLTDRSGMIKYINPQFSHVYGYLEKDVIGKTTPRILKSASQDREFYRLLWEDMIDEKIVHCEFYNKTKEGKIIAVESTISAIMDDYGNISGFLAIQRDVTERKQHQEILKSKNEELEKFNKFAVGRELKMIELKKKIRELEEKLAESKTSS